MENIFTFTQSCDSRVCKKNHKEEVTDICEAIATVHKLNRKTGEITCTECGKITKLSK